MDTRQRILESASRLFHEQGFAATGVATILREAGVNSGSLYHFFASKDAVLEEVLEVADTHPRVKQLLAKNFQNWVSIIHGWLDEAPHRLPDTCDRKSLACFILTVMEGGVMQSRAAGSVVPFDQSVDQLRNYMDALIHQQETELAPLVRTA